MDVHTCLYIYISAYLHCDGPFSKMFVDVQGHEGRDIDVRAGRCEHGSCVDLSVYQCVSMSACSHVSSARLVTNTVLSMVRT